MKIFILSVLLIFATCNNRQAYCLPEVQNAHRQDSIKINTLVLDNVRCTKIKDSLVLLNHQNDSLKTKLFLANYKINKVKFYLGICMKNSSQDKFLKGWIKRAVE